MCTKIVSELLYWFGQLYITHLLLSSFPKIPCYATTEKKVGTEEYFN